MSNGVELEAAPVHDDYFARHLHMASLAQLNGFTGTIFNGQAFDALEHWQASESHYWLLQRCCSSQEW